MTSAPLHSMTGFARARRSHAAGEIVVSVKTVNHRGLDIHIRGPEAADPLEASIRAIVKGQIVRGHVEVRVSLPGSASEGSAPQLNRPLLDAYMKAFQEAADALGIDDEPDINAALRAPGMLALREDAEPDAGISSGVLEALGEALAQLNSFREREGDEIATEMRKHNARIAEGAAEMERIRECAAEAFQARLNERLKDLLKGAQVDPQRLAQEAAILADRSDIGEELARLRIHSAQVAALLEAGGEAGKKLDFLLQEMNREANTILSKTSGIGETGLRITELGLAAKADIEKIREQSLNLE